MLAIVTALAGAPGLLNACAAGSSKNDAGPGAAGDLDLVRADVKRSAGLPDAIPDTVDSISGLAAGLYGVLASQPGNLVLSPYSVAVALAMTLNGAEGPTADEMRDVLGVDDLARFNDGLDALTQYVEGLAGHVKRADDSSAELSLSTANQLFGQRDTTWQQPFLDALARYYGAGMRLVDYEADTEGARSLINGWTADQTHDRIPEIIPDGVLDDLTRLVLVNAIYLKAPWEEPFEPDSTAKRPFHTDDGGTVDVDTMTLGLDSSGYATGDGWEAVRLLYASRTLAMTIVLPAQGALERVSAMVAEGGLSAILDADRPTMVQLSLPKWEFRTQSPLKDVLTGLGMPIAFDPDTADFSGMTSEERLYISAVLHEGFIAVNEEGTEAAAATAVVMEETSMPLYQEVVVDRPFLFVVHDVEHGTPLFLGRVSDPTA